MEKLSLKLSEDNKISIVYDNGNEINVNHHDFYGLENNEIEEALTSEDETPFVIFLSGFGNMPLVVLKMGSDSDEVLQEYVSSEEELYRNSIKDSEFDQDTFDSIGSNVMGIHEAELITK